MRDLERAYRRLLWAYPGFYRRERGPEILTTLLDAAEPGQVRPSRGEAAHLLVNGLRYRFVPPTWIGRLATGLVAIWAAVVLSGAGALAVWALANPEEPDLAAFSDELVGRPASSAYELPGGNLLDMAYAYRTYGEFQDFAMEGWGGGRPAPMGRSRIYEQVTDTSAVLADVHQQLTSAGWRTGALNQVGASSQDDVNSARGVFWASRDGVLLRVSGYDNQTGVTVGAYPVEPRGVLAGAVTGFLIGLIVVWQAMTWMAHRIARTSRPARRLILLLGLPALLACTVNTLDNVLSTLPDPGSANVLFAADHMYPLANQIANPLAATVIALALTGILSVIAAAARINQLRPASTAT
ncbi:hypothetical protein ACGFJ4_03485 [Micromonospora chalcea]|uniref:hypothetical protein n=1 Tax=Micromonospora TaxID=1873 RepID=UPI001B374C61|nr:MULTISPECIES: hypothetical protein [Micromonospora]MBQ1060927.1 hypothetical protein [Micromonospora sp. C41]WDP98975.1 hypothetical protein PVK74_24385 [Micromonospora chalcea]